MFRKYLAVVVLGLMLVFSACARPKPQEVEKTVEVEKVAEKVVEKTVEVEPVVEVTPQSSEYVAILVVDDFVNVDFPTISEDELGKHDFTENSLCVVALHEQGVFIGEGVGLFAGEIPHGWLVYEEIKAQIGYFYPNVTPYELEPVSGAWEKMDMWQTPAGDRILLVPVDTQAFRTDLIAKQISNIVNTLHNNPPDPLEKLTRGVVLNMSFAMIPCNQIGNTENYLSQLKEFDSTLFQDLLALAQGDFLYNMLIGEKEPLSVPVVSVAAAGNESVDFPYAPAILDGIIGVSALQNDRASGLLPKRYCSVWPAELTERCEAYFGERPVAWYSNFGAVALDGNHSNVNITNNEITLPLPGTSFAAPKMSFLVARYLLRHADVQPSIWKSDCSSLYPPMPTPPPPDGYWRNWNLEGANNNCPDFLEP